jgi:hypothetical protein
VNLVIFESRSCWTAFGKTCELKSAVTQFADVGLERAVLFHNFRAKPMINSIALSKVASNMPLVCDASASFPFVSGSDDWVFNREYKQPFIPKLRSDNGEDLPQILDILESQLRDHDIKPFYWISEPAFQV